MPSLISLFVFAGSGPLVFFEGADKVAQIIEAIAVSHICDAVISGIKLNTCFGDPLTIQIIHGSLMCHFGKKNDRSIWVTWTQMPTAPEALEVGCNSFR